MWQKRINFRDGTERKHSKNTEKVRKIQLLKLPSKHKNSLDCIKIEYFWLQAYCADLLKIDKNDL